MGEKHDISGIKQQNNGSFSVATMNPRKNATMLIIITITEAKCKCKYNSWRREEMKQPSTMTATPSFKVHGAQLATYCVIANRSHMYRLAWPRILHSLC